jgi:predicted metal-dependent peptidase
MEENLRQALLKLLNKNTLRYYGLLVYNYEFLEDDNLSPPTMAVGLSGGIWHIWYHPFFVSSKPASENVYVIIHEIVHSLGGHCFRQNEQMILEFWQAATDHVININLDKDIDAQNLGSDVTKPADRFIIQEIKDKYDWSAEMTYEWLMENADLVNVTLSFQNGSGTTQIPGKGIEIKSSGKIYVVQADMKMSPAEDAGSRAAKDIVAQARVHANSDRTRGLIGSNIRKLLSDIIDIYVPPERILENAIRAILQRGDDRSWRIPNKRLMAHGYILPAVDNEMVLSDVIFLNDHSGSISDVEIKLFSGVMKNCAHLFTRLHIIKHDYVILKKGGITVLEREQLLASKVLFEAVGRGGTSHKEPFDYVQKEFEKGTPISLVIGLTDWASDIEFIWHRYTFHRQVPLIWVIPGFRNVPDEYGPALKIIRGKVVK